MISNRHVRRDFRTWLDTPLPPGRSVAMCGKRVQNKYLGVPGVTEQAPVTYNSAGKARRGWCFLCAMNTIEAVVHTVIPAAVEKDLRPLYNHCVNVLHDAERDFFQAELKHGS